jgi:hypothetical protein
MHFWRTIVEEELPEILARSRRKEFKGLPLSRDLSAFIFALDLSMFDVSVFEMFFGIYIWI